MFGLFTQTPQFFSDLADEVRLFEEVKRIEKLEREDTPGEKVLRHFFLRCGAEWQSRAVYLADGAVRAEIEMRAAVPDTGDGILIKKMQKRLVKQTVYGVLKAATGKELPWGSLTGIRPTKLFRELQKDIGTEAARELFLRGFDVSDVKTDLAQRIAENQRPFLEVQLRSVLHLNDNLLAGIRGAVDVVYQRTRIIPLRQLLVVQKGKVSYHPFALQ